jgi:hypothetical protein
LRNDEIRDKPSKPEISTGQSKPIETAMRDDFVELAQRKVFTLEDRNDHALDGVGDHDIVTIGGYVLEAGLFRVLSSIGSRAGNDSDTQGG